MDNQFDRILQEIIVEDASSLLSIPGVYEILSEHYNNEVLKRIEDEKAHDGITPEG